MLITRIDTAECFHEHAHADRMAAELQAGDEDWTYTVIYTSERWAYVECRDEDGAIIGRM